MKLLSYSKALYATWHYVEPLRLLFDAGEGLNSMLEGRLLAFRCVAITHAHTDHFTGLQNIIVTRLREMEVTKEPIPPLQLIYPADSHTLLRYFEYLKDVTEKWNKLVNLVPIMPGETVMLEGCRGMHLTALKAEHFVHRQTALAYRVEKEQWSLRPEFQDLPQKDINRLIGQHGREHVTEKHLKPLIFYSGDGNPLYDEKSKGCSLLIQESTFIEVGNKHSHATLAGAIKLFRRLEAKNLVLFHLSTRYLLRDFFRELDRLVPDESERSRIYVVHPGGFFQKDIPVPGL